MARRRIADVSMSRLAVWSRRCAFFSLAATAIAIVIVRSGFLEIVPALATFAGALVFAGFSIMLAFGAFVVIWRDGSGGLGHAVMALGIGAALLAYPAYLGAKAYRLPMINDVTTDPIDPPRFDVVAQLRPPGSAAYAGLYAAEQQREAYPDVEPLDLSSNAQAAYDAALQVITKRKWRIMAERPPQAGRRDGQIEAIARTPIMGFREDVSLRIRTTRGGVRIDVRSASRLTRHDLGSNAARVKSLLDDIDDVVTTKQEKDERAEKRKAQQQKPAPAKGGAQSKKPSS
jgi:uncharacterized protein (DUF1499 family)